MSLLVTCLVLNLCCSSRLNRHVLPFDFFGGVHHYPQVSEQMDDDSVHSCRPWMMEHLYPRGEHVSFGRLYADHLIFDFFC